jgi:hypothetical protein
LAFAFDAPRISVIITTPSSPASCRAEHDPLHPPCTENRLLEVPKRAQSLAHLRHRRRVGRVIP